MMHSLQLRLERAAMENEGCVILAVWLVAVLVLFILAGTQFGY